MRSRMRNLVCSMMVLSLTLPMLGTACIPTGDQIRTQTINSLQGFLTALLGTGVGNAFASLTS